MKKIIATFIVLLLCFSLVACISTNATSDNNKSEPTDSNETASSTNGDPLSTSSVEQMDKELFLGTSDIRKIEVTSTPVLESSYKDDEYYYYLFYLGQITNVPLDTSFSFLEEYIPTGISVTKKTKSTVLTIDQVATASGITVSEAVSLSSKLSSKISTKAGTKNNNISAEIAASLSTSRSNSKSFSESYSRTATFSKENEIERTLVFSENTPKGFYGYCATAALDMYAFVVKDQNKEEYSVETYTEVSKTWMGFYYFSTQNEFLNYKSETITFDLPSNLPIPEYTYESPDSWKAISVTMDRYDCNYDAEYNKAKPEKSDTWRSRHDGFELGELIVYGCKQDGSNYRILSKDAFSIKWKVIQDVEDLPRVGADKTEIAFDDCKTIYGTDFNEKINEGAYWVRVTYDDDTQKTFKQANIMENAMPGTFVELCNNAWLDSSKTIKQIECIIVYELYCDPTGFMSQDERTNWRLEYKYNFN